MGKKNKSALKVNKGIRFGAGIIKDKHALNSSKNTAAAALSRRKDADFDSRLMQLKERNMKQYTGVKSQHQQNQHPARIAPPTFVFMETPQFQQTDSSLLALMPSEPQYIPEPEDSIEEVAVVQRSARFAVLDEESDEEAKYLMKIAKPTFSMPSLATTSPSNYYVVSCANAGSRDGNDSDDL